MSARRCSAGSAEGSERRVVESSVRGGGAPRPGGPSARQQTDQPSPSAGHVCSRSPAVSGPRPLSAPRRPDPGAAADPPAVFRCSARAVAVFDESMFAGASSRQLISRNFRQARAAGEEETGEEEAGSRRGRTVGIYG